MDCIVGFNRINKVIKTRESLYWIKSCESLVCLHKNDSKKTTGCVN